MISFTANTTHGELIFSINDTRMVVSNLSTDEIQMYSGEPDEDIVEAAHGNMDQVLVAQGFADNFYADGLTKYIKTTISDLYEGQAELKNSKFKSSVYSAQRILERVLANPEIMKALNEDYNN